MGRLTSATGGFVELVHPKPRVANQHKKVLSFVPQYDEDASWLDSSLTNDSHQGDLEGPNLAQGSTSTDTKESESLNVKEEVPSPFIPKSHASVSNDYHSEENGSHPDDYRYHSASASDECSSQEDWNEQPMDSKSGQNEYRLRRCSASNEEIKPLRFNSERWEIYQTNRSYGGYLIYPRDSSKGTAKRDHGFSRESLQLPSAPSYRPPRLSDTSNPQLEPDDSGQGDHTFDLPPPLLPSYSASGYVYQYPAPSMKLPSQLPYLSNNFNSNPSQLHPSHSYDGYSQLHPAPSMPFTTYQPPAPPMPLTYQYPTSLTSYLGPSYAGFSQNSGNLLIGPGCPGSTSYLGPSYAGFSQNSGNLLIGPGCPGYGGAWSGGPQAFGTGGGPMSESPIATTSSFSQEYPSYNYPPVPPYPAAYSTHQHGSQVNVSRPSRLAERWTIFDPTAGVNQWSYARNGPQSTSRSYGP